MHSRQAVRAVIVSASLVVLHVLLSVVGRQGRSLAARPADVSTRVVVHDIRTAWDWYVPQGYLSSLPGEKYTTTYRNDCGPSTVAMVVQYLTMGQDRPSPNEVRRKATYEGCDFNPHAELGGDTGTCNLDRMLRAYGIEDAIHLPYDYHDPWRARNKIENAILRSYLVLLPLHTGSISEGVSLQRVQSIPSSPPECPSADPKECIQIDGTLFHFNRSTSSAYYDVGRYDGEYNHWILIKGIGSIDGEAYFIVYDPAVFVSDPRYHYTGDYMDTPSLAKGWDRWYKQSEVLAGWQELPADALVVPHTPVEHNVSLRSQGTVKDQEPVLLLHDDIQMRTELQLLEDITIPSGTQIHPVTVATKTWRVYNAGNVGTGIGLYLRQVSGTPLDTFGDIRMPQINAGQTADVSMSFLVPRQLGLHTSTWQVIDANGIPISGVFDLSFEVVGRDPYALDGASFLADMSLPDGSSVTPNQSLTKTWRVRNSGTSTWEGYRLRFVGGDRLNAPQDVPIAKTAPGDSVDISVGITAPAQSGDYAGYFQLINALGTEVRGGRLWVKITVQPVQERIALYVDPPSPSSADRVYIKATVSGVANVRAMRLLIDGKVVSEFGGPWVEHSWDTTPYADGQHAIVAQVAKHGDDAWANIEQRGASYELQPGRAPANQAPRPPSPTKPGDWHVGWSLPELCATHNGDPDGDSVTHYYFDIYESSQLWNSGWVTSSCVTPQGLASANYQWRARVRDSRGGVSDWGSTWHFSYLNPEPKITRFDFSVGSPSNAEEIWIYTNGTGNVNETIVRVNLATDGSASGAWHGINHYAGGLEVSSLWRTLGIPDGTHLVRVELRGVAGTTYQDKTFTLTPNRRPSTPSVAFPVSDQWVNSRSVTFRWEPAHRRESYRLVVSTTHPDPLADPNPVANLVWTSDVTQHTVTFPDDHEKVYCKVLATNSYGTTGGGPTFGIDTAPPTASVVPLPAVSSDTQLLVRWSASDNLSGVSWYDVQVRDGARGEWNDWLTHTTRTSEIFTGRPGHTYFFRVRAMDPAGNLSEYPTGDGDTHTLVDPTSAPPPSWWNTDYGYRRGVVVLNQDPNPMPQGFPVRLRFNSSTSPTAQELYNASLSGSKGADVRIVYRDATELHRVLQRFSSTEIDIWFPLQAGIAGNGSNSADYSIYYGNAGAGAAPASVNAVFLPAADANTIGLWHFQDGAGSSVADTSGRNHNGTFVSPGWTDGWLGWAGVFNGSSSYVNVGNASDLNVPAHGPMTVEAWIYTRPGTWQYIVAKRAHLDDTYWFQLSEGPEMQWKLSWNGGQALLANYGYPTVPRNTWVHVAATFDGQNTMRVFLNGQQQRVITNANRARTNSQDLLIGYARDTTGWFSGYIQHLRISNVERTDFPYARITMPPSVQVGAATLPPESGTPDLSVQSMSVFPVDGVTFERGVIAQAVVQNVGDAATTNGFETDFYADHLPVGPGDITGSVRFLVNEPIEPGAVVTLTTVIDDIANLGGLRLSSEMAALEESSATLYAQTDSLGVVPDAERADNIFGEGVTVCIAAPDAYEDDSDATAATPLAVGGHQVHSFHAPEDVDWVRVELEAEISYVIQTSELGPGADTYLYLYAEDGITLLASNDDDGTSLASRIVWAPTSTGTYYTAVRHWNPSSGGCGNQYTLSINEDGGEQISIYLPMTTR